MDSCWGRFDPAYSIAVEADERQAQLSFERSLLSHLWNSLFVCTRLRGLYDFQLIYNCLRDCNEITYFE
jgi:hypothetical protein